MQNASLPQLSQESLSNSLVKSDTLYLLLEDTSRYQDKLLKQIHELMKKLLPQGVHAKLVYKGMVFSTHKKAVVPIQNIVEAHNLVELYELCATYKEEVDNTGYTTWYLIRLLSEADSIDTVKKCLPEHLHTCIKASKYTGSQTYENLFVQECFDSLESALLKNTLLGS